MKSSILVLICMIVFQSLLAQEVLEQDRAIYKERQEGFYQQSIKKSFEKKSEEKQKAPRYFGVDFSGKDFSTDINDYEVYWHNTPLSQGATGTCWSFAAISFV